MGASPRTQQRLGVERSRRLVAGAISEAQFQAQVIELAEMCGWRVLHIPQSMTSRGDHLTAVAPGGAGWPDLVLVHPRRRLYIHRELKKQRGTVSAEQRAWGEDLIASGQDWAVWRPSDWPEIERLLRGRR